MNTHRFQKTNNRYSGCFTRCTTTAMRWSLTALLALGTTALCSAQETDELTELKALIGTLQGEVQNLRSELLQMRQQTHTQVSEAVAKSTEAIRASIQGNAPVVATAAAPNLKFYGYFKADAFTDSATTPHQEIPFWALTGASNDGRELDFTARQTRFGFNTSFPEELAGGNLTGKLEMDFYGFIPTVGNVSGNHAYQLRTRHAYLQWENKDWTLLAGKTFDAYYLQIPDTLNFAYYNFQGQLGHRRMQFQATRKLNLGADKNLALTFALDEPVGGIHGGDLDGDGIDDGTDATFPGLVMKSVYTFPGIGGRKSSIGISGFYLKEQLWNEKIDGYAAIIGGSLPLTSTLTLKGTWWTGSNVDSAWGGIGQGINTTTREAIAAQGGWVQLNYKPSSKLWFNVGYSYDDPEDTDLNPGQRACNTTYLFNSYYQLFAPLKLGFEYFQIQTEYVGLETATNHRLMGSVIYSF